MSNPNALLADLSDHTLSPAEVCTRHGLTIDQLAEVMASEPFLRTADAVVRISAVRANLILATLQHEALHTLAAIAQQPPTTPGHTETVRKAVGTLLRYKPRTFSPVPAPPGGTPPAPAKSPSAAASRSPSTNTGPTPSPAPGRSIPEAALRPQVFPVQPHAAALESTNGDTRTSRAFAPG